MDPSQSETWLATKAESFLRGMGVQPKQTVLDFGCGEGHYAIPAARIVGRLGIVYALDKKREALDKLMRRARREKLRNVRALRVQDGAEIPLGPRSVDMVLLYDVLHGGYFPEARERRMALRRLRAILKPRHVLSCHLTHLRKYGLTYEGLLAEISDAGFCFPEKRGRELMHDGKLVRRPVFRFVKCGRGDRAGRAHSST